MKDGELCDEFVACCFDFNLLVECISTSNDFADAKELVKRK